MTDRTANDAALRELFDDYARAYDAFDAPRIAAFFHVPCLMVNGDAVVLLPTEHAVQANMAMLVEHHRVQGYGSAHVEELSVGLLGTGLALVESRWNVTRADGSPLWRFRNTYNLVDHGQGWRILVSTTHAG